MHPRGTLPFQQQQKPTPTPQQQQQKKKHKTPALAYVTKKNLKKPP